MLVRATQKGFHLTERKPGDVFECPLDGKGRPIEGSWYEVVKLKGKDKAGEQNDSKEDQTGKENPPA